MNEKPSLKDDFDNYINYEWKMNNKIPEEYPRFTNFTQIDINLEKIKMEIAENKDNVFVNSIYELFLNQDESAIKAYIQKKINLILDNSTKQDLINYLLREIIKGNYLLFHIGNAGTERNPHFQIPNISFGGLSLSDRDYYLEQVKHKEGLMELMGKQLNYFGIEEEYEFVWELEKTIAKSHYSKADKREPLKCYHPMTLMAFKKIFCPYFDEIDNIFPSEIYDITVNNADMLCTFKEVFDTYSLSQLKIWYIWKQIRSCVGYLHNNNPIYQNHFAFYMTEVNGVEKSKDMKKRAANFVEGYMEDKFSEIYVTKYVDPKLHSEFPEFVEKIRASLMGKLNAAEWMCEETRLASLDKLRCMNLKVVSPSEFRDYGDIDCIQYNNVLEFIDRYYQWDWEIIECKEKMYKLRNPLKWEMSAMTVNAYYHPLYNEIVFPAGILQSPFYDSNGSYGANVGGIGAVIAHEMTHGFDDQGSKFDKNGYLYDWWSVKTRENYETLIQKMEDHFATLTHVDLPINARLTQGENLADLGGLKIALNSCDGNKEHERECMVSWAKIWAANVRHAYAQKMITLDPHSPPHLRINGILQHIEKFYEIFDVGEGDGMFMEEEKRCGLWN